MARRTVEGDRGVNQIFLAGARTQAADVLEYADEMRREVLHGIAEADLFAPIGVLRAIHSNVGGAA